MFLEIIFFYYMRLYETYIYYMRESKTYSKVIFSLHPAKEITKKIYDNIMNSIKL